MLLRVYVQFLLLPFKPTLSYEYLHVALREMKTYIKQDTLPCYWQRYHLVEICTNEIISNKSSV